MNADHEQTKKLFLGAAYYPEHWSEERWAEDIRLMKEAGLNVVRMAEFAWARMEPADGDFQFEWLEKAIALLQNAGIQTVLGTPTAAPPVWLAKTHPEIVLMVSNGQRAFLGTRCHFCPNSETYLRYTQRIAGRMTERFGKNPAVIGWQIDNEYNRVCYCSSCRRKFQQFLELRYGTLDNLNTRWTTHYWSQVYRDWSEIELPTDPMNPQNPGLRLEFQRFQTETWCNYQKVQLEAMRPHLADGVWVTHNFIGGFGGYDHYAVAADLDLAAWDYYVGTGHHEYLGHGVLHDLARGFKRKNFWVMETQPGTVNWAGINNPLYKWEGRTMAWQAIAHGADAFLYWQWRSALNGQEQYHGTLVDQSGQPRPFYQEVQALGREFAKAADLIAGSSVKSRVALLYHYESRWSIEWQRQHKEFDYIAYFNLFARPLAAHGINLDVLSADAQLTGQGYRLVIAPALIILDDERARQLRDFVEHGGHLVLTARCGMKDRYNALLPSRQPGPLAELAGVEVEEFYALDESVPVKGNLFKNGFARIWAERLKINDEKSVAVAARYTTSNGWLDDQPAITAHAHRNGMVYYVGTYLDEHSQSEWVEHILRTANLIKIKIPAGVEMRTRTRPDGQEIHFIINHERSTKKLQLPWKAHDHLSGQDVENEFSLAPYSVVILTRLEDKPGG